MSKLEVPKISEIKSQLGEHLAKIFIEQCPYSLREEMSLQPKLNGSGYDLWISPSDILINKVVLKPPLTNKHIKALTHQGILAIGQGVENKFYNEIELEKKKALHKQQEFLNFCAIRDLNYAVDKSIKLRDDEFKELVRQMNATFEDRIEHSLNDLVVKLEEDYNQMYQDTSKTLIATIEQEWQTKLNSAVQESVAIFTKKFLGDMQLQETQLSQKHNIQLESQKNKYENNIKDEQLICKTTLKQLKHNLQCNNIANLMYVLCVERRKCFDERMSIINDYKTRIQNIQDQLSERNSLVNKLTAEKNKKEQQANLREECLLQVIRQFQKFINFALRATPGQAEFLLSVEKMMMFELTQAILKTDKHPRQHLAKLLIPWKLDSKLSSAMSSAKADPDYHNCLNELNLTKYDHADKNDNDTTLPGFYYNETLYVREDFRNMFSQGLAVSSNSKLWNKDVKHLMHILRKSVSLHKGDISSIEIEITKQRSHQSSRRSSVHFDSNNAGKNVTNEDVFFTSPEKEKVVEHLHSISVGLLATKDSLVITKTSIKSKDSLEKISKQNEGVAGLSILAAPDSLTIIKPRGEYKRNTKSTETFFLGSRKTNSKLNIADSKICTLTKSPEDNINNVHVGQIDAQTLISSTQGKSYNANELPITSNEQENDSEMSSSILPTLLKETNNDELVNLAGTHLLEPHKSYSILEYVRKSKLSLTADSLQKIHNLFSYSKSIQLHNVPCATETVNTKDNTKLSRIMEFYQNNEVFENLQEYLGYCILKLPDIKRHETSAVNFCPTATIYAEPVLLLADAPWEIYEKLSSVSLETLPKDNFLNKPNKGGIVGNMLSKEYIETRNDFTIHRIHSILDILKKNKSLIRIFTSCAQ